MQKRLNLTPKGAWKIIEYKYNKYIFEGDEQIKWT